MSLRGHCPIAVLLLCLVQILGCGEVKSKTESAANSLGVDAKEAKANTAATPATRSEPAEPDASATVQSDKGMPAGQTPQTPLAEAPAPTPTVEPPLPPAVALQQIHVGYPAWDTSPYGYFLYLVPSHKPPQGMLVLVHTGIDKGSDGTESAKNYIDIFAETAQQRNLVLVAPAFSDADYGGHAGPVGGYRGLVGRNVSADAFLNSCVDRMLATFPDLDRKFYLHGDGCGAQLVSRYIVKHPDRIRAAVMSRSGTYAFPFPDVRWTNGMARLQRMVRWSDDGPYQTLDFTPDPQGWLKAAQLPVAVVVGALDTNPLKTIEGEPGLNTVERARNYVREMHDYAQKNGVESKIRLIEVKGAGYNYLEIVPACTLALFAQDSP